jgi:hypothetical protein
MSLGRELSRRSLRRNFPIDRAAAQDRDGDARHLVGERHRDKLEGKLPDGKIELLMVDGRRIEKLSANVPGSAELPIAWDQL